MDAVVLLFCDMPMFCVAGTSWRCVIAIETSPEHLSHPLQCTTLQDFGDFLRRLQQPKPARPASKPAQASGSSSGSSTVRPSRIGPASGNTAAPSNSSASAASGCPLRKLLGPAAGLVFNPAGHISCPAFIVQARAALAATAPVRQLRPQALHVKLAAVAAIAAAVNVPCGAAREHTEKFSWQWVVCVHASVPFVAMLRKAVIMPKLAIILTIACAVAGQQMGARLERSRLAAVAASGSDSTSGSSSGTRAPTLTRAAATTTSGSDKRRATVRKLRVPRPAPAMAAALAVPAAAATAGPCMASSSGADWRMDRPGDGGFKQLLLLPAPKAVYA